MNHKNIMKKKQIIEQEHNLYQDNDDDDKDEDEQFGNLILNTQLCIYINFQKYILHL